MILSVAELRTYITTDKSDAVLESLLSSIESAIRKYTNNNFQRREFCCKSPILGGVITTPSIYFSNGDTLQVTESLLNNGLYVLSDNALSPTPWDCQTNTITKVDYPSDIKMGVVNLVDWDLNNRDKVGIASETISRHSVTFSDLTGENSLLGYPAALTGFLVPYMKARF